MAKKLKLLQAVAALVRSGVSHSRIAATVRASKKDVKPAKPVEDDLEEIADDELDDADKSKRLRDRKAAALPGEIDPKKKDADLDKEIEDAERELEKMRRPQYIQKTPGPDLAPLDPLPDHDHPASPHDPFTPKKKSAASRLADQKAAGAMYATSAASAGMTVDEYHRHVRGPTASQYSPVDLNEPTQRSSRDADDNKVIAGMAAATKLIGDALTQGAKR